MRLLVPNFFQAVSQKTIGKSLVTRFHAFFCTKQPLIDRWLLVFVPGHAFSTIAVNADSFAGKTNDLSPITRADARLSHAHAPQSGPEPTYQNFRTQRFEKASNLLSTQIDQSRRLKGHSPPIRSTAWLYLFDLATCPEQLERVSNKFSQFVETNRPFREEHVNAFVRTCFEHKLARKCGVIDFALTSSPQAVALNFVVLSSP